MTYRVWRIRNRITGRYLALCRADGSLDYIAFLTKQMAQAYMTDKGLSYLAFSPAEWQCTSPGRIRGALSGV